MSIKSLKNFKQKIFSFINIYSPNTQIINNNANKEVITYLLEKEFNSIDIFLERGSIEEAEIILENISVRKEKFTNNEELKFLEYKGLIAILKKEFNMVKIHITSMERYKEYENYKDSLLLNSAIGRRDIEEFNNVKTSWELRGIDNNIIIQNEVIFWFHIHEYQKVVEIFKKNKTFIEEDQLFLIGQAYINIGLNEEAVEVFKSCSEDLNRKKLWILIAEFKCFTKKNIPIDELKEKEEIKKFEIQILDINKSNLCFNDERNFVLMQARIKFFLNLNECESLILEFKKLYDFVELDILYIDVLEQLNNSTEAEKIYELLVNQEGKDISIDLVIRGIFIKYNLEKYDEVKILYEKYIDFTENTSQVTYYYGLALIKILGVEEAKSIIEKKILCEDEFDFLLLSEVNINEKKICESYLNKLQLKIDRKNYFNLYIADIYYRFNEFDKAYNVLLEGASTNKIFFKRIISLASKTDLNSKENNQIFKIYIDRYKTEVDSYIGEYIYMLLVRGKRYIQAQVLARKMYEAKKNIYWTNNYLEMKLVNEELDGIDELIKSVQSSNESKYIINAALSYMKQGLFELCKEVCFKAYFKIQTNEEFVLLKIGTIGLEIERFAENISGNQQVGSEFILTLGDIGGQVKKYFFTNENILSYNLKILNDIEVCSFSNDIFIEVLDKGKGEKIIVDEKEFTIIEKINKYEYMFRQGITYLLEDEESITEKITIKEEDGKIDIQSLIDKLKFYEDIQKENIQKYLSGKIPFFLLCGDRGKLPEWIERLSKIDEYNILAGCMNNSIKQGDRITISLSGIFILYFKGKLISYIENFEVIVGKELLKELNRRINKLTKILMVKNRTIFLIEGKFAMNEESVESKKRIIKTYKEILRILEKAKIVDVNLEENELLEWGEGFIPIADVECIEIAKQLDAILIIEDYMLSGVASSLGSKIRIDSIANITVNLILDESDIEKNIKFLEVLISEKYGYVFCEETLEKFIYSFELNDKWRVSKFKNIINLLIKYDFGVFYAKILLEISRKMVLKDDYRDFIKINLIRNIIYDKYLPKVFAQR